MSTTFHYQAAPRLSSPLLVAASGDDVSGGAAVGSNERFGCRLASVLILFSSSFFLFGSGRPELVVREPQLIRSDSTVVFGSSDYRRGKT
ncbi:hypothetical protein MUK42_28703 [Musa troglodytarum]|uniref:Uncharacterized protein n=1 Tax=Musa troglodytarum TaxID=320322 RepID=A0A9E7GEA7_9LILI|nr:hypothetical protein MUK42_28703 [Musa troglodytarum]